MNNQIIGIICAMDIEMAHFLKIIEDPTFEKIMNFDFVIGNLRLENKTNKLVIAKCGIGKVNAGIITTLMIEHFHPNLIFNSGIAGGFNKKLKTKDIVIGTKFCYSDVDMTTDDSIDLKYGQLQDLPAVFKIDSQLLLKLKNIKFPFRTYFGSIITGDQFLTDYRKIKNIIDDHFQELDVLACDMESAAIFHACFLQHTPCIIVRAISDIIGSTDIFDYQEFAPIAANNAAQIIEEIIKSE